MKKVQNSLILEIEKTWFIWKNHKLKQHIAQNNETKNIINIKINK